MSNEVKEPYCLEIGKRLAWNGIPSYGKTIKEESLKDAFDGIWNKRDTEAIRRIKQPLAQA